MKKSLKWYASRFYWSWIILIGLLCSVGLYWTDNQSDTASNLHKKDKKQRGINVFGRLDSLSLAELTKNNVEWITLVPFGGQSDYDSPSVRMGRDSLRQLRRDSSLKRALREKVWVKCKNV